MEAVIVEIMELIQQCEIKAKKSMEKYKNKNKCLRISIIYNETYRTISVQPVINGLPDVKLEKQAKSKIIAFTEDHFDLLQEVFETELSNNTTDFWANSVALCLSIYVKNDSDFLCSFPLKYGKIYEAEPLIWKKSDEAYKLENAVVVSKKAPEIVCDEPVLENEFAFCTVETPASKFIFTSKSECEKAYQTMLEFLIAQLENGFSLKYSIELKTNKKMYLTNVAKTDTNCFFTHCGEYSELSELMRKYFRLTVKNQANYIDTYDGEEIMPCGGYAAFALGMADPSNFDIVSEFMQNYDSEHVIAPRYLVYNLIDHYGWSESTANVFCDCIYHGNDVLAEAKNLSENVLDCIFTYVKEHDFNNYQTEILVNGIWENFEEKREKATGKAAEILNQLAEQIK